MRLLLRFHGWEVTEKGLHNSARQQLRALGVDVDDQPIAEDFQERLASNFTVWRYVEDPALCQRP